MEKTMKKTGQIFGSFFPWKKPAVFVSFFELSTSHMEKPSSFKFLSILEENCGADINNGTIKCKFLLTNVSKNGRWVSYTFLQKPSSFKLISILEENCGADINNRTIKCKFLLTNVSQNGRWVSHTFLQKLSSFKFYSILEENCVADINNEAFECNIFVDECCNKRPFEWLILS